MPRERPLGAFDAALGAFAIAVAAVVIFAPIASVTYPPMTDLPMHAAHSSALRHWWDEGFRLREQFHLRPIAVPYLSMYVLAALLELVFSPLVAIKLAAGATLALLPIGTAVLARGLGKSPLLGLAGLVPCWFTLTHWGFLNFVGALGLFAATLGLTLLVLDRPTRSRRVALAITLVALFFTHIFRFPFALAAIVGAAILHAPLGRRALPLVLPALPGAALFATWWLVRPKTLQADLGPLALHGARLAEIPGLLFGGFRDPAEAALGSLAPKVILGIALAFGAIRLLEDRVAPPPATPALPRVVGHVTAACCALAFLGMFLVLPMSLGDWWYVYPREATAAAYLSLALLPDLPRTRWLRGAGVLALAALPMHMAAIVRRNYEAFEESTRDFAAVTMRIPRAPKLLYLIFDHSGSTRATTPYIHLPAYVQADRGGWLSFHFAVFGASPLVYRDRSEPGAVVPPPVPTRWEWTPEKFDVLRQGAFFDWFLVRSTHRPDALFRADPTIVRVESSGRWTLYAREGVAKRPGVGAPAGLAP